LEILKYKVGIELISIESEVFDKVLSEHLLLRASRLFGQHVHGIILVSSFLSKNTTHSTSKGALFASSRSALAIVIFRD
jgi:hypothetical protein